MTRRNLNQDFSALVRYFRVIRVRLWLGEVN